MFLKHWKFPEEPNSLKLLKRTDQCPTATSNARRGSHWLLSTSFLIVYRQLTLCQDKQNSIFAWIPPPEFLPPLFPLLGYRIHPFSHRLQSPRVILDSSLSLNPSVQSSCKSYGLSLHNTTQIWSHFPRTPESPCVSSMTSNFFPVHTAIRGLF